MPSVQGRRVLVVIVAAALVALLAGLVNAHRTPPAPIVVEAAPGGLATPTPMPVAPDAKSVKGDTAFGTKSSMTATTPVVPTPSPAAPQATVPAAAPNAPAAPKTAALIYVHVAGAVKNPSLYQLPPDSRVWHAIKAAGGPTAGADENAVNLAAKIHDGEKIFVPAKAAHVPSAPAPQTVAVAPVMAIAPASTAHVRTASVHKAGTAAAAKPAKLVSASQGQVNINTAGPEQLQELPGIGPAMAARIVGYRQQAGGFQKPEDLMMVGGIGPKKFERIAPLIKLH